MIFMTREQAKQNLIAIGIAEPTKEMIDSYLNQFGSETRHMQSQIDELNGFRTTAEQLQAQIDEAARANMTDMERLQAQLAESQKAVESANQQAAGYKAALNKANITSIFAKSGLTGDFYAGIIDSISAMDDEQGLSVANTFVEGIIKNNQEALASAKQSWEAEKLAGTANPGGGAGPQDPSPEESAAAKYAREYSEKMNPGNTAN